MVQQAANETKKSKVVWGIGLASLAWGGACVWLFNVAKPCAPDGIGFLSQRVYCLESNAMGDTLAGAFAPLAFLWLIAAVFLQRDELAAQRQELVDSREVAKQQVEESKKNVTFIGEQTDILRNQYKQVLEERRTQEVARTVTLVIRKYDHLRGTATIYNQNGQRRNALRNIQNVEPFRLIMMQIDQLLIWRELLNDGWTNDSNLSFIALVEYRDSLIDLLGLYELINEEGKFWPLTLRHLEDGVGVMSQIIGPGSNEA